jgi:hypothetical protein
MASKTVEGDEAATSAEMTVEVSKRLVVELTKRASQDMSWLIAEEEANKTTIVNRALQVYKMVVEAQRAGDRVMIGDPEDPKKAHILYLV